ncbi:MAG: eukaryotic-like serine/threonine-protein kinase [Thermoplasmata archaeon]|nr:eukaryotic-like serine/threonine-protein kinase [Thermoplasmata archaeon]
MLLVVAGVALGAAVAAAGVLVILLRPEAATHKVLGALLVLRAAYMVAYTLVSPARDAAMALLAARLAAVWSLALPALTLYLAGLLWPGRLRAWRLAVGLLAGAALLMGALAWARPALLVDHVARFPAGWTMSGGPLLDVASALASLAGAAFVVAAAREARDEAQPETGRRAAALLGAAFGAFLLYAGSFFLAFAVLSPRALGEPTLALRAGAALVGGALVLLHLRGLARAFGLVALLLASLGGLDGLLAARPDVLRALPGYAGPELLLRLLFVSAVVLAVARYGLAGAGERERARARSALRAFFAAALGACAGLAGLAALGESALGLAAAGAVALVAIAAAWGPLDLLATRALLAADDPRAVSERARRYAAALAAARGAKGRDAEALLAELRRDLGVSAREDELLRRGLESRDTVGRYVLGAEIGRGATATVRLATDAQTGREVVVKRYHSAREGARVVAEARALAAVRSPRVVRLLEVDRREGEAFLVMERAPGGSAADLLAREGPLAPERALALADDLLEGLEALHAAGLVHGDVKCENLLLDAEGRGVLADFGSARAADPGATLTGAAVEGSLATMAPEVAAGEAPRAAADVYAAGAVLYRLLTGEHPLDLAGVSALEARARVLDDAPRLPHPRVPARLEALLARALAKEPRRRPAGAAAFRAALKAAR